MIQILSPITGEIIQELAEWTEAEVADAVTKAKATAEQWRDTSPIERGRVLSNIAELMLVNEDELVEVETENLGTTASYARAMVRRAASTFRYFGSLCDKINGDIIPVEGNFFTYSVREPYGVVAAVVPWNAPLIFAAKKMAPALAFGNACVLKPSPETPLSALVLERIMAEAGLPEGVGQVVVGGRSTGEALTNDPRIDLIVFTGHDATGAKIAEVAASHLTPVALELGGKSAQVVFNDAPKDRVVEALIKGIFSNSGQACIAGSRILIQDSIAENLMERLADRTRSLKVGDPFDPATEVGPQATEAQLTKTMTILTEALAGGAEILAQAALPADPRLAQGFYAPPTLLTQVTQDMPVVQEEIFGPVATVQTFSTEAEAVEMANSTEYGLAAGLWTENLSRALRVSRKLRAGTVWVNTYKVVSDRVPFGGIDRSGYGREGGNSAVEMYTRVKSVWASLHGDEVSDELLF